MTHDSRKSHSDSHVIELGDDNTNLSVAQFTPILRANIENTTIQSATSIKLQSPFRKIMNFNWKTIINHYFDSFSLFDKSNFDQTLYNLIHSLSSTPNSTEIEEFINEKITTIVENSMDDFFAEPEISIIHTKIESIKSNIENLNILFGSICFDISDTIFSLFRSNFSKHYLKNFKEMIQNVLKEFCHTENFQVSSEIIKFFTEFNLLTNQTAETFRLSFITNLESLISKNPIESTGRLFTRMFQLFPIGSTSILETITDTYLKKVIKMDLVSFLTIILPHLLDYFEDFYNFAYSTDSPDDLVDIIIQYFSSNTLSLNHAISLLRIFKNFSIDIKHQLARRIRNSVLQSKETNAVRYSEILDKDFRRGADNLDFDISQELPYDIPTEMLLIQNRTEFEHSHFRLMFYRALEIPMISDCAFIEDYKSHFGCYHSQKFESLLRDYNDNSSLIDEFRMNHEIPSYLNIFVLESSNWICQNRFSVFPESIQPCIEQFGLFYKEKRPKRCIQWSPTLSSCELSYNEINIKCNAFVASILFSLSGNKPKSLNELSSDVHSDKNEIEVVLETLISKKFGNFVICKNNKYSINTEMSKITQIDYPGRPMKRITTGVINQNDPILMSESRQIEAAIIICIKGETEVKLNALFQDLKERLGFHLDYEVFLDKIKSLNNKHFIRYDQQNGAVVYLP